MTTHSKPWRQLRTSVRFITNRFRKASTILAIAGFVAGAAAGWAITTYLLR